MVALAGLGPGDPHHHDPAQWFQQSNYYGQQGRNQGIDQYRFAKQDDCDENHWGNQEGEGHSPGFSQLTAGLRDDCGVRLLEFADLVEVLVAVGAVGVADGVVEVDERRSANRDTEGAGRVGLAEISGWTGGAFVGAEVTSKTPEGTGSALSESIVDLEEGSVGTGLEADAVGECVVVAALETGGLVAGVAVGVWTV